MKYIITTCLFFMLSAVAAYSQLYTTRTGLIGFYSKTPLEDIKADNKQVYAAIDAAKKNLAFSLLMKGFLFERALQQEHFNENYVESDKFPKASFSGMYSGEVNMQKDGSYPVTVKGNLTIHGVTKNLETPATLEVKSGRLLGNAKFNISPEDYAIIIPSLVRDKIAKQVTISIQIDCNPSK